MLKVSIITPIYKGEKYIPQLINMISDCAAEVQNYADVEWIISNDNPDIPINEEVLVSNVNVIVLQTDKNRGIDYCERKKYRGSTW